MKKFYLKVFVLNYNFFVEFKYFYQKLKNEYFNLFILGYKL